MIGYLAIASNWNKTTAWKAAEVDQEEKEEEESCARERTDSLRGEAIQRYELYRSTRVSGADWQGAAS